MLNFWQVLALIAVILMFGLCCGLGAAWLWFRASRKPIYGETFAGSVPKGEVFTIRDAADAVDEPEEDLNEASILKKTEEFLKKLGGEGQ